MFTSKWYISFLGIEVIVSLVFLLPLETVTQILLPVDSVNSNTHYNPISHLIKSNFGQCSLFIIELNGRNELDLNSILSQTQLDTFISKIKHEDEDSKNFSSQFQEFGDLRHFGYRCKLILIFVPQEIQLTSIGDFIFDHVSRLIFVLTKDRDYFAFFTHSQTPNKDSAVIKDLLISSQTQRIKNKIVLNVNYKPNYNGLQLEVHSSCIYCNNGNPKILQSFTWNSDNSNNESKDLFPYQYSQNFEGKVFKLSFSPKTQWLGEYAYENGTKWVSKRGVFHYVVVESMLKYNFTCVNSISRGGGTGSKLPNGTWVGTVGDVLYQRADLGQSTGRTWSRGQAVEFTKTITFQSLAFSTGKPSTVFSWKAMFWPLSPGIWIGLGISLVTGVIAIYYLVYFSSESLKLVDVISHTIGTLVEQSDPKVENLSNHAIRVFIAFWLIFTLLIMTAYRSKLVSSLAFPLLEKTPKTFEQLSKSKYEITLQFAGGAALNLIKSSSNPYIQKVVKRMKIEPDAVRCHEKAIGKRFACISWSTIPGFISMRNLSDRVGMIPLITSPESFIFPTPAGIIMEKQAVFRSNINSLVIHAMDGGLLTQWNYMDLEGVRKQRKIWDEQTNQTEKSYFVEATNKLKNLNLMGAYYLLVAGCICSILMFAIEFFTYRYS